DAGVRSTGVPAARRARGIPDRVTLGLSHRLRRRRRMRRAARLRCGARTHRRLSRAAGAPARTSALPAEPAGALRRTRPRRDRSPGRKRSRHQMIEAATAPQAGANRAMWLSTFAFTVCFAVWTIFSIIGIAIQQEL